ncbi:hypothetical protein B0A48_15013 [Cryoendolithus antarcticus]|uniref:Major facilitator superfamily (MFS) profile domain-containing protein n=1 Tax=Cryoendolithus antarcticus TaxID=1507870 RepID=A0A1V8SJ40_9PEZI|nr:hypothetical protein B0A48_15013 [Cryoendolithus antarcticus]OQO31758.1 hypothetical protein B0A51_00660 [Rachicladosporium sp. CCFEE 5018]
MAAFPMKESPQHSIDDFSSFLYQSHRPQGSIGGSSMGSRPGSSHGSRPGTPNYSRPGTAYSTLPFNSSTVALNPRNISNLALDNPRHQSGLGHHVESAPNSPREWHSFNPNEKKEPSPLANAGPPPGPPGGPPPDGGLTAWLQVLGGYCLFMNTWGIINAFGVFQSYYVEVLLKGTSNSTVSWIGTITSFLLCASPLLWGPIFDRGNIRILVICGSLSVVFGIMMTSLCTEYYQIILAQGICVGIGGGCTFLTATSILPTYFAKKRALAMGIAASGSSLGGIIYPIVFHTLQPKIGFGWSVRIIGLIALVTLTIPCLVMRPRGKPPPKKKLIDPAILKEVPFGIFNLATFFGFVGQYIPFFFIEQFAAAHGIANPFWMLIVLNAGSIPGRIVPSLIADRFFPPLIVLGACTGSATVLAFAWTAIQGSYVGLLIWALLYGFCAGAFVSLQGPCVASMTKDLRTIGTRFGINMFAGALGILIGSPVGGAIFPKSWPGAQAFCGATLLCSTISIAGTWYAWQRSKTQGMQKLDG